MASRLVGNDVAWRGRGAATAVRCALTTSLSSPHLRRLRPRHPQRRRRSPCPVPIDFILSSVLCPGLLFVSLVIVASWLEESCLFRRDIPRLYAMTRDKEVVTRPLPAVFLTREEPERFERPCSIGHWQLRDLVHFEPGGPNCFQWSGPAPSPTTLTSLDAPSREPPVPKPRYPPRNPAPPRVPQTETRSSCATRERPSDTT